MRRLAIVAGVLAATLVTAFTAPAAETPAVTIHAQFVSSESATHYTLVLTGAIGQIPVVFWKLTPIQIDANGTVDPTCTKTEVGKVSTEFIWHHGNGEGCDHSKEGAHGHQGRITVKAELHDWDCETTYDGSTGVPPDGPTELCTPLTTPATGPCDDERAQLAQIEAELAAAEESLRLLMGDAWRAYYKSEDSAYEYWSAIKDDEAHKAAEDWDKSHADELRISKAYDDVLARIKVLRRERIRAAAALAACGGESKRLAAHQPAARCSAALLAAAGARGRAAGYAEVARRFHGARFAVVAGRLRSVAAHLRGAAAKLPKQRSRLLADAKRADAAATALIRSASGRATVDRKRAAASKSSTAAQAALAKCQAAGG